MTTIGLDNGLSGGIVALSPIAGLPPIAKFAMPVREVTYPARKTTPAKTTREIDTRGLIAILDQIGGNRDETVVYFEHCPFHADTALTMRSMALSAGKILAVLEAKNYKTIRVLSFDWQPVMLGKIPKGQTKKLALAKARELWPEETWLESDRSKKPHDGMIDAALIAEFGRRIQHPSTVPDSREDGILPW